MNTDSQILGPTGQTVSPAVTKIRKTQIENSIEKIGKNHRDSQLVTMSREKSNWRREGDSNPTVLPVNKGESHGDSRIDSRNPIPSCPDLAQVVTAWAKLSSPIKAAILALVKTAG
jgi:hypothetical protein